LGVRGDEAERRVGLDLRLDGATHHRVLPDVIGDGDRVEAGVFGRLDDPSEGGAEFSWPAVPVHGRHVEAELHPISPAVDVHVRTR
jgi:hypothetical protein